MEGRDWPGTQVALLVSRLGGGLFLGLEIVHCHSVAILGHMATVAAAEAASLTNATLALGFREFWQCGTAILILGGVFHVCHGGGEVCEEDFYGVQVHGYGTGGGRG